jgi:tetratricopeptide (TPR) repeat protein
MLQQGAAAPARAILSEIAAREPTNADALSLLGIALAQSQDLAEAADVLRRATLVAPHHPGAHMNYGGVLKRLGRLEEAAACFERVIALRPDMPVPALKQLGSVLLDLQRCEEAVSCYSRVLAIQPHDAVALNDRGLAQLELKRAEAALSDFEAALRVNPRFAGALGNKGLALMELARAEEALRACDDAIALEPSNPGLMRTKGLVLLTNMQAAAALACFDAAIRHGLQDATTWALHADALKRLGRQGDAIASFERAVVLDPQRWDALIALGTALTDSPRVAEAIDFFNRAVNLRPDNSLGYFGRARAARELGQLTAALFDADRATELAPHDAEASSLRLRVLRDLGRREDALAECERALALSPNDSFLHGSRGVVLEELQRHEEAIVAYQHAFELDPRNWIALQNMGGALVHVGRGEEAVAVCDEKLREVPQDSELWTVKATILQALHRIEESIVAYDRAIELKPDYAVAHFYRSLALLTQGRLQEGFAAYEWRRLGEQPILKLTRFGLPEPSNIEDVRGKRLMLYREQGLGDVIQFARFARTFVERGARVSVLTYPPLAKLLASLGDDIAILVRDGAPADADFAYPLMSAPVLLQTTAETIPAPTSYLTAPPELAGAWRDRLASLPSGLRVGLSWSGSAQHVNDWARSIPFDALKAILGVPAVTFVSVQKDVRASDEAALSESGVADFRVWLTDLAETAAMISELDLVITVDTSVAHLAGALGKPVWILLATRVDWRWLAEGTTSAWYPTARLFRQTKSGDWGSVLAEVRAALVALAEQRG